MTQSELPEVTGPADWGRAKEVAKAILDLPNGVDEEEIRSRTRELLERLFPKLKYPDIAVQFATGDGPADVVCRNLVVETKGFGKMYAARPHPNGSPETPTEQLERYISALSSTPDLFYEPHDVWRGIVTDGVTWDFYTFDPYKRPKSRLLHDATLPLNRVSDIDSLVLRLHEVVDRASKIVPPTHDGKWADEMVDGFVKLANKVSESASFSMKLTLWRDMLQGAFITSPNSKEAEIDLFASHTMLVVAARAVAIAIDPKNLANQDVNARNNELAKGFASWLLDIGGNEGEALIQELVEEVDRFEWRRSDRDNLKDLYHAVIPRAVRHDFGEYYTPDWLARAVCEEVLDEDWRKMVVDGAVSGTITGPAVLDPSCGSGTFLYHACKLLMETAAEHPDIKDTPLAQAQAVNGLVAGMDLHPVAVELAKTTKALAFASVPAANGDPGVFLGDSLHWSLLPDGAQADNENVVVIPTADADDPIRLPRSLVMSDHFSGLLQLIFRHASLENDPGAEDAVLALLDLRTASERKMISKEFRRFKQYIRSHRNHVWMWYIENLVQPLRLGSNPVTRMVGNPPWVVYNKMESSRQDKLRSHAQDRNVWAPANLAPHNDLAATFVATCVDDYLVAGGKFGFVMPYAMLKARQWEGFRQGQWSSLTSDRPTTVDLSVPAWDMTAVVDPPFPHVNSCVVFGGKNDAKREPTPLGTILRAVGDGINARMSWNDAKRNLKWEPAPIWPSEPSEEYATRFRQGAILSPQSLVVFDPATAQRGLRGIVKFATAKGKNGWDQLRRSGQVEPRYVLKAVFSRHLVPFGITGHLNAIAPVAPDGKSLEIGLPSGDDAVHFRTYWSGADLAYKQTRLPKSEPDLLSQIDNRNKLSARLAVIDRPCVVYRAAGSWLSSAVVDSGYVIDSTLYWLTSEDELELHYLAAVFNAPALAQFFHEKGRNSDRHFHTGPIQYLPIPKFDRDVDLHSSLANASRRAHRRVADLMDVNRHGVLADSVVRDQLDAIDQAVRAILPEYCTSQEG